MLSDTQPDTPDPNIVLGPRKRRPTERLRENGDPLACKRARKGAPSAAPTVSNPPTAGVSPALRVLDGAIGATVSTPAANRPLLLPGCNTADSSDDGVSDNLDIQPIDVDASDLEDSGEDGESQAGATEPDEDDDTELARLRKEWDAPIYVFFKPLPTIEYISNCKAHIFHCAATQCHARTRSVRRFLDTGDAKSTSNLRRHAKACWGEEAVAAADSTRDVKTARAALQSCKGVDGSITTAFQRLGKGAVTYSHRQYTRMESRVAFVRWVTESNRPFQIVNDPGFRMLMKTGRPDCYIPSAETLSHDVKNIFVQVRARISKKLKEFDGKLNFATDAWSSPNHKAFVAFTVHLEDHGKPKAMLLDIVEVAQSHTGVVLGDTFVEVLKAFGIENKVLSITADNASNNDTMFEHLGKVLVDFPGAANQTRCFAHTINLCAKSILKHFDLPKKNDMDSRALDRAANALADLADNLDNDAGRGREKGKSDEEEADDQVYLEAWASVCDGLADNKIQELDLSVQPARSMLAKLRKLAFDLKNSPTILLPAWYKTLAIHRLSPRMMPRDVSTRWNSTFDMLEFAILYRTAIDAMTAAHDFGLRQCELVPAEWKIAGELRDVLKIFKDATLFFSRGTPNLATVIPAMDIIDSMIATTSEAPHKFCLAIRAALAVGSKTINKYYNKTDSSEVYRIAMVLHPRHKLEYFKKNNWDALWIETAHDLVREEFDRSYASMEIASAGDASVASLDKSHSMSSEGSNFFDNLLDTAPPSPDNRDELDRYLAMDVEDVKDGVMWWYEKRSTFSRLSCMARDYLSIPATTVDVERVFSRGRLVLPHVRNRLGVQSTRASLCVGQWSSLGLVKDGDIKISLGTDDIVKEDELPEDWDAIPIVS